MRERASKLVVLITLVVPCRISSSGAKPWRLDYRSSTSKFTLTWKSTQLSKAYDSFCSRIRAMLANMADDDKQPKDGNLTTEDNPENDEEGKEDAAPVEIDEAAEEEAREKLRREREARAQALTLEIVGDLPYAEVKPPENVLFVCKLNPVTEGQISDATVALR